ncbi:MAG: DUF1287 domain-containing protein [Acidobacteria bacterium]|nr:DUF1287 domain-containing protein [Acidobacteriota bacterium]
MLLALACAFTACAEVGSVRVPGLSPNEPPAATEIANPKIRKLLASAEEQLEVTTGYTQDYFTIAYPNGDVPAETGACTDVVIRAFRRAGIDLQKEVHEDMRANFREYPQKWGLTKPDTNIDHRRVPNLQAYFRRKGKSLPITASPEAFKPGDVVSWDLDERGTTHIGLVSNRLDPTGKRYLIIHNIGGGARLEDRLFEWTITGHFRYFN